ncbi:MAG: TPD domain-containing protein [Methanobacteriota archaeon]|nr:MAG: TPD domain-containing protein [Euryarchaeota archaeon]
MKYKEYKQLTNELNNLSDIPRLARERGLQVELLHVIYTQKVVRDVTKRYYRVKRKSPRMLYQWNKGKNFVQIAKENDFPASLIAMMVLQENKIPRKRAWRMLLDPTEIRDSRLRKEIIKANKSDGIYSPNGSKRQVERGKWGENRMRKWLNTRKIAHQTEADLRGKYPKTPDFLLRKPLVWDGHKKFWIESKATFGDAVEIKKHLKKQLTPYVDLFGDGLVVYWFGYIDDLKLSIPDGVSVTDGKDFDIDMMD